MVNNYQPRHEFLTDEKNAELWRLCRLSADGKASEEEEGRLSELTEQGVRLATERRLTPAERREFYELRPKVDSDGSMTAPELDRYFSLCDKALYPPAVGDNAERVMQNIMLVAIALAGLCMFIWWSVL